jgi:metal-responsive CopG/Arc/MetJ family transcriptional regulator
MKRHHKEVQITFRLEEELAHEIERHAESRRVSRSWLIREAIYRYLREPEQAVQQTGEQS